MEGEYISSSEKQVGRKIRVYYHLLPKGSDLLLEMMKEYHDMVKSIDYIMQLKVFLKKQLSKYQKN